MESKVSCVKRFKWYFAWKDRDECAWLEEMSKQGYHMKGTFFGLYTFCPAEPEEYLYRIDFCDVRRNFSRVEAIEKTGWERAAVFGSWVYYRGRPGFTDPYPFFDSSGARAEHYKAVLKAVLFPGLPLFLYFPLMSLPVRRRMGGSVALLVLDLIIIMAIVFVVLGAVKLRKRVKALKDAK